MRNILRRIVLLRRLRQKWNLWRPYFMSYFMPEESANLEEQRFIRQHRFRKHPHIQQHLSSATKHLIERHGHVVLSGPFKGMQYINEAFCSGFAPKLIGCYEAELQKDIVSAIDIGYDTIIDIGAAEGYYAVGFARSLPRVHVVAFEADAYAKELCLQMVRLNSVEAQIEVRGQCDVFILRDTLRALFLTQDEATAADPTNRVLVICDCEGYEIELLNPEMVPELRKCDLIVELHDCFNAEITPTITERFSESHTIKFIGSVACDSRKIPESRFLSRLERRAETDDLRGFWMNWGILTAR